MANLKSAIKRIRTARKSEQRNQAAKSRVRHLTKKALENATALRLALSEIDKAAVKGILHKRQAARRKSRLTKRWNTSSASAATTPAEAPAAAL